jgi:hypothetical protein
VNLPQVGPARVPGDARAVLDRYACMAIALHPQTSGQSDGALKRLREAVGAAAGDRDDLRPGQGCLARALNVKPGGGPVSS